MSMNNDTRGYLATIIAFALGALFLVLFALNASAQTPTCKDVDGFDTNLEGNTSGEWGSITFEQDNGPLVLNVNENFEVTLCIKKATEPIVQGPFGEGTYEVNYPGFEPADGFSHYALSFRELPSPSTTTTTSIPTTTTTVAETTTTTIAEETTTTNGEESTTTTNPQETTTSTEGSEEEDPSPTTTSPSSPSPTLPFTGIEEVAGYSILGLILLSLGGLVLAAARNKE